MEKVHNTLYTVVPCEREKEGAESLISRAEGGLEKG